MFPEWVRILAGWDDATSYLAKAVVSQSEPAMARIQVNLAKNGAVHPKGPFDALPLFYAPKQL